MTRLDAKVVRRALGESTIARLATLEAFEEIDSTNSYLMRQAAPAPGQVHVAITDNQTSGRGRHGRTWLSPPGSGLCLSLAYTFAAQPGNLPALTLAVGLGVIEALERAGVDGVRLKWPNDLIADDGKLGGILTETLSQSSGATSVVTGVGINIDLGSHPSFDNGPDSLRHAVDLARLADEVPSANTLATHLIVGLVSTFGAYDERGFSGFQHRWSGKDWLRGRTVTVSTQHQEVTGVGAGIADDGALLVETSAGECCRISSGTVLDAGREAGE